MAGFRLLMLGAMYENGGNTTHRFLDGHPALFVYPFESQLGTRLVSDALSSVFPSKYRWPVFPLEASPAEDYKLILDEECKVRARTPQVSKFRHVPFDFSDEERGRIYREKVGPSGRSGGSNVAAFFEATFQAWKDYNRSGRESVYVGYSPIVGVDAEKIFAQLPGAHVLHVVRNPWSAYADTKKRPVPLSLRDYLLGWCLNQHHALYFRQRYPEQFHVLRFEDLIEDPFAALGEICRKIGVDPDPVLARPTWNGRDLSEIAPWGTIRVPAPEANLATARELSEPETEEIRARAGLYLEPLGYADFLKVHEAHARHGR